MALQIPSFPNPFDNDNPLENAYAWLAGIGLDIRANQGLATFNVHPTESAWESAPVAQVQIALGETLVFADPTADPPVEVIKFPTLDELMADPEFAAAYNLIGSKLYAHAIHHKRFQGSTVV